MATTPTNVLGGELLPCSYEPLTGYYRTGCCESRGDDPGMHVVCVEVTDEFLAYSKRVGNDLSTPAPHHGFAGLVAGDRWCLCASRWSEALDAGVAPKVHLEATHLLALEFVSLADLKAHARGMTETVGTERHGDVLVVTIQRPEARNAVDGPTAAALVEAFDAFEADESLRVAILTGAGGTFCAGADLKAVASGRGNRVERDVTLDGPMGPTRRILSKPVIAAVEGYAVAGGLELALWCDLRVAAADAVFGVFCRRWGVPLIDGGTVRLPRIVGQGRALDMILTGREVGADEALAFGLATAVVPTGEALPASLELAARLAALPQICLRSDRESAYRQWDLPIEQALSLETELGLATLLSGEGRAGAQRFADGAGRGGATA